MFTIYQQHFKKQNMARARAICDMQTRFSGQLYHIAGCFPGLNIIIVLAVSNMR